MKRKRTSFSGTTTPTPEKFQKKDEQEIIIIQDDDDNQAQQQEDETQDEYQQEPLSNNIISTFTQSTPIRLTKTPKEWEAIIKNCTKQVQDPDHLNNLLKNYGWHEEANLFNFDKRDNDNGCIKIEYLLTSTTQQNILSTTTTPKQGFLDFFNINAKNTCETTKKQLSCQEWRKFGWSTVKQNHLYPPPTVPIISNKKRTIQSIQFFYSKPAWQTMWQTYAITKYLLCDTFNLAHENWHNVMTPMLQYTYLIERAYQIMIFYDPKDAPPNRKYEIFSFRKYTPRDVQILKYTTGVLKEIIINQNL
jgi:hypothetical protein